MSDAATTATLGKHGTKWLGAIGLATSMISGIDPSTVPPTWLPYIGGALSLLTVARGFINTKNQQQ
jgi:hypothetical protein